MRIPLSCSTWLDIRTGGGTCLRNRFPRTLGGTRISPGWTATRNGRRGWTGPASTTIPPGTRSSRTSSPLTPDELAEIREAAADELLAVEAATTGRRGPGQPGSARVFPGESSSPAAAFGPGMPLDVLPGCAELAVSADAAARRGPVRRRPRGRAGRPAVRLGPGRGARGRPQARRGRGAGPPQPRARRTRSSPRTRSRTRWRESRVRADAPDWARPSAWTPICPAPGPRCSTAPSAWCKARIIATATALLDEAEARAAEDKVLDRAARLTPGGLRAAIARAVMEVAPEKAKKRRETAARSSPGWSGGPRTPATPP